MICKKHGDVGTLIVNVRMKGLTGDDGVSYCMVCFNEMMVRECCILEDAPADTKEGEQLRTTGKVVP